MKISREHRLTALIVFLIVSPLLAWLIDDNFAFGMGFYAILHLMAIGIAVLPAGVASAFNGFKNFVFSWAGAWLGGTLGIVAGAISNQLVPISWRADEWIFSMAFFIGLIGGAILGSNFKGFNKNKTTVKNDLGYVLSQESIDSLSGIKMAS